MNTWETYFTLFLCVAALYLFIKEVISPDLTAIVIFAALLLVAEFSHTERLPSSVDLLAVFGNPAPMTVAAMFVLSRGLEKSGAMESVATKLNYFTRFGYVPFVFLLVLVTGALSAFINNTPVVVVMVPVVLALARSMQIAPSKLLIPLSFAAVSGGVCTLLGTSTNLVVNGMMKEANMPQMHLFELAWIGVPMLLLTAIYLALAGKRLLPSRESLTSILTEEERREYLTEAFVHHGSPLAGKSLTESGLLKQRGLRVLEIIRDGVALTGTLKDIPLVEGDRLVLAARPSGIAKVRSTPGIDLAAEANLGLETIAAHEGCIVEGVIGPKSSLVGFTLQQINFRQRFRMIVIAIHRNGVNLREQSQTTPLQFGDILLMMGTEKARDELRSREDILLLDQPNRPSNSFNHKIPLVIGTIAAVVALSAFEVVGIHVASIIGCAFLFITKCLTPKEGYDSIEWSILIIIWGMLGLGQAMEVSGAAQLVVDMIMSASSAIVPEAMKAMVLLALFFLITTVMTEFLSNNAAAVLMFPLALRISESLGVDSRPFMIVICIAASAAFATPIGYQTNTYVYGIGNYKFSDFCKIGIPLNLLYFIGSMIIIPMIWPLQQVIP